MAKMDEGKTQMQSNITFLLIKIMQKIKNGCYMQKKLIY